MKIIFTKIAIYITVTITMYKLTIQQNNGI